jgi:hypothetical protein
MTAVYILYLYLAIGFILSIWFVFIQKSSLNAHMPIHVKLIILPGFVILWPVTLYKTFTS